MKQNNIFVIYGNSPVPMVKNLMEAAQIINNIPKSAKIGLKPNLVTAKPSTSGATTTPEIVTGIIEYLLSNDRKNISILEGSWIGDSTKRAFTVCGYDDISRKYKVPLIDLQKDGFYSTTYEGLSLNICNSLKSIDYLINLPVLKGHCQTLLTCALKNLKGCIPDNEKRRYHSLGLHKPIAHLNHAIKTDLVIVDSLNGDLNFEEGGNPVEMNQLILGKDPVLIDTFAAELLGYESSDIPYIGMADKLGVGSSNLSFAEIIYLNKDMKKVSYAKSGKVKKLSAYITEKEACSACYGSLIHALDRLDDKGLLNRIKTDIYIGQGYKGQALKGIGIGMCAKGADTCVVGCPPSAKKIMELLDKTTAR